MKIKCIVTAISMVLCFWLVIPSLAKTNINGIYIVSNESVSFLDEHKVDVTPFEKLNVTIDKIYSAENPSVSISKSSLYDEDILSFKRQTEAYNFSDEQIQKYVQGLLENSPTIIKGVNNYSTESMPLSTRTASEGYGYEVKSLSGYYEETAYATIPSAFRQAGTSGYLFYTVSSANSSGWGIDVGLWYGSGSGGTGWRGFYTADHTQVAKTGVISELTPGKRVYTIAQVRSDGYLQFKAIDANDFSKVYVNFIYYVGDHNIWTSNGIFNRQITLCNSNDEFIDDSYMYNAKFSSAYLYSNTGYAKVSSTNTDSNRRGAFGPLGTNGDKVTVNNYTAWDSEDISISFD